MSSATTPYTILESTGLYVVYSVKVVGPSGCNLRDFYLLLANELTENPNAVVSRNSHDPTGVTRYEDGRIEAMVIEYTKPSTTK